MTAAQSTWYRLTGADGDFAIDFPGKPAYEEVPVPATGDRLRVYHFAYGNNYLSLKYFDLRPPSAAAKASSARLDEYARDYTKTISDAGGQVLRQASLPDGGMELVSKYPAGQSREMAYEQSRVYFRGARRYVISCTALSTSGIDQPFASRFFSSLHFYGPSERREKVDKDASGAALNSPAAKPASAPWYRFVSPDGDFEAKFPDKPHYDTTAHPVTGAQMQSVSFTYGEHDFSVSSTELLPPPATSDEREHWFAGAAEKFVRGSGSSLIRQTRLADGSLQIESRRQINGRALFIRARFYVRGTRGYVVACSVFSQSLSALDGPLPARFFDSFRLK